MTNASISIPAVLTSSVEYGSLDDIQRRNFVARLNYCLELSNSTSAASQLSIEHFAEALDNIELDALAINGAFGCDEKSIAIYQIHSSWTFEANISDMIDSLSRPALEFIENRPARLSDSVIELKSWLAEFAELLDALLYGFGECSSYGSAIGRLITIDALVSHLITFAALSRFNQNFR